MANALLWFHQNAVEVNIGFEKLNGNGQQNYAEYFTQDLGAARS